MSAEPHTVMLMTHIAFGFTGLVLGSVAILLPKFGRSGWRHCWVGRAYAVAMLIQASLAARRGRPSNSGSAVPGRSSAAANALSMINRTAANGIASRRSPPCFRPARAAPSAIVATMASEVAVAMTQALHAAVPPLTIAAAYATPIATMESSSAITATDLMPSLVGEYTLM